MTKIMINRDLLERIGELMHIIAHRQDDYGVEAEYLGSLLKKVLTNPAQQGEAVEVVGYMDTSDRLWADTTRSELMFPLMTVAQHKRILAASVPAGCKVVPVELLERVAGMSKRSCLVAMDEIRVLLATTEG